MFAYNQNGLNCYPVDPGSTIVPGEVWFPVAHASPTDLTAAFPGYPAAVQVQTLTAQISALQLRIDALDGGTQARSVRAGLLAVLPAGNADLARLQALETSIVPLRAEIAPLQTQLAATQAALTAATTPAAS